MCCYTHAEPALYGGRAAEAEEFRCRCGYGGGARCVRQATEEDGLCARCREPEPALYGEGTGWYAPGRVGYIGPPLGPEPLLANYRIGLTVADPSALTVVTGTG